MSSLFRIANALFILAHLILIFFTLFGWIPVKTRRLHLCLVLITAFSWIVLGFWFGFGYCFLTDWHWMIRRKLGVTGDPSSFIKLFIDFLTGADVNAALIDTVTAVIFALVSAVSIYLNLRKHPPLRATDSV